MKLWPPNLALSWNLRSILDLNRVVLPEKKKKKKKKEEESDR